MIDILYRKRGRRYVAVESHRPWGSDDVMKPGQVRLEVCTAEGERSYQYGIEPDLAAWHAAALLARAAMVRAICDASVAQPEGSTQLTEAQREIIERFGAELAAAGALIPQWWQHADAYQIAEAAIKAVKP